MSKPIPQSPFQALEAEAYHAFREWPLWLALRERELADRTPTHHPAGAAPAGQAPQPTPTQGETP